LNNTAALGKDRGAHFASAVDPNNQGLMTTGFFVSNTPHPGFKDVLVTVNTKTHTKSTSTNALQRRVYSGLSLATVPAFSPWHVVITVPANKTATGLFNTDVATGITDQQVVIPWNADTTGQHCPLTVARGVFDIINMDATSAVLLQPCTGGAKRQQLVRVDLTTLTYVSVDISPAPESDAVCIHAPGLLGGVFFGLATGGSLGTKEVLVDVDLLSGIVNYRQPAPADFSMRRRDKLDFSPFAYSGIMQQLYALSGDQTKLARFDTTGGDLTADVRPFNTPVRCRPGAEIHSFAGILP
jgi:hypothetical protein